MRDPIVLSWLAFFLASAACAVGPNPSRTEAIVASHLLQHPRLEMRFRESFRESTASDEYTAHGRLLVEVPGRWRRERATPTRDTTVADGNSLLYLYSPMDDTYYFEEREAFWVPELALLTGRLRPGLDVTIEPMEYERAPEGTSCWRVRSALFTTPRTVVNCVRERDPWVGAVTLAATLGPDGWLREYVFSELRDVVAFEPGTFDLLAPPGLRDLTAARRAYRAAGPGSEPPCPHPACDRLR
jgi:hypothetical protein